jgi:LPS sulfotransferase NodH
MSLIGELFGTAYDFPESGGSPTRELMMAATPRSGSTAFSLCLWETGRLGSPLEYLNLDLVSRFPRWAKELSDPVLYWDHVQRVRTSPNGVFSYKMFPQGYKTLLARSPSLIERIKPTHVLYFTRRNLDRQSVSYSRAIQSGAWFGDVVPVRHPIYHANHIATCKRILLRQMQDWEHIFSTTGTEVLRLTYEQFQEDRTATVNAVADFVGVRLDAASVRLPGMGIQGQLDADMWMSQFRDSVEYVGDDSDVSDDALLSLPKISVVAPRIEVRDNLSPRGRGVYAGEEFEEGQLVECAPVIVVPASSLAKDLARFCYEWLDAKHGVDQRAIAFGYGSLYNHADSASLSYRPDYERQSIRFTAKRRIERGCELTINYNSPDGEQNGRPDFWFVANKVEKW